MGKKKSATPNERTNGAAPAAGASGRNGRDGEQEAAPQPRLHGEMLSTTLLAFLRGWNAYGYELTQRLAQAGLPQSDSGTVYRTLRQLERSGLVSSFWDTSESGPARRMYSLTAAGEAFLSGWIDILERYQQVLRQAAEGFRAFAGEPREDRNGDDSQARG
ncbi:helix-turn-helix transcriptional regulator [Tepidiforma flava]|uniref:Helix-turn-helix transcriptional regulator n=1 Tax=Tepidiforma flava TaxID=3004094 RepID=A0ABY7M782_9CHLR|nr:helix-turn-helix transcriptional regulator [Tepidiforma flava]WBL36359.1 helix-turn-helix transcriptional regulator [Tepidiforma flava]